MAIRDDSATAEGAPGLLAAREIIVRSDGRVRRFSVGPRLQGALLAGAALLIAWTGAATVAAGLSVSRATSLEARLERLEDAHDKAVADLRADAAARSAEAETARERLAALSDALTERQTRLLDAADVEAELSLALETARANLREATSERDAALIEQDGLRRAVLEAEARADAAEAAETEWTTATAAMVSALEDAATERDVAVARRAELDAELSLRLSQAKAAEAARARLYDQLEDAVAASLGKLEGALSSTGFDVDKLVKDLRADYSGEGGPFIAADDVVPAQAAGADAARIAAIMGGLERAGLLNVAASKMPLAHPVRAAHRFTSGFGARRDPFNGRTRMHSGVDFAASRGTPIHAAADGVVVFAGWQSGYGRVVKLRHAFGFETVYAHLNAARVKVGDRVAQLDRIGDMGRTGRSTGVHLHYEIRLNGRPVNPMKYIEAARNVL
ncbi:MAG: DUF5930 domain-containing protein [Pseudomonadota bacterium]